MCLDWWFLYFVQEAEHGFVKIGITKNFKQHLYMMQTDNHNKLNLLGFAEFSSDITAHRFEQRLHAMFASDWVRGEWFKPSDRLLQTAKSAL